MSSQLASFTFVEYDALIIHSTASADAYSLSATLFPVPPSIPVVAIDEATAIMLRDNYTYRTGKGDNEVTTSAIAQLFTVEPRSNGPAFNGNFLIFWSSYLISCIGYDIIPFI